MNREIKDWELKEHYGKRNGQMCCNAGCGFTKETENCCVCTQRSLAQQEILDRVGKEIKLLEQKAQKFVPFQKIHYIGALTDMLIVLSKTNLKNEYE